MPISKKQLMRLIRLVAQLKENRFPNCKKLSEDLAKVGIDGNLNLACTEKTIFRDIQALKKDFSAPIAFDRSRNGYYLKHHGWSFSIPYIRKDEELLAAVIGARLTEQIFPEPLNSSIRKVVDEQLAEHNPDFLDKTIINSLIISPALEVNISSVIFSKVFAAWQSHEAIALVYLDVCGKGSERIIEPHCLIFTEGNWWIYGFCTLRNAERSFAMHRIQSVKLTGKYFIPSHKIIDKARQAKTFEKDIVKDVEIVCSVYVKNMIIARKLHEQQTISQIGEKSFLVFIPEISEYLIAGIVLRYGGAAEIKKPLSLRKKIQCVAKKIVIAHEQ